MLKLLYIIYKLKKGEKFLVVSSNNLRIKFLFNIAFNYIKENSKGKVKANKTAMSINWDGKELYFKSDKKIEQIRGHGAITQIWIEESSEISEEQYKKIDRLIIKNKEVKECQK